LASMCATEPRGPEMATAKLFATMAAVVADRSRSIRPGQRRGRGKQNKIIFGETSLPPK
jgi:hypothetical protein